MQTSLQIIHYHSLIWRVTFICQQILLVLLLQLPFQHNTPYIRLHHHRHLQVSLHLRSHLKLVDSLRCIHRPLTFIPLTDWMLTIALDWEYSSPVCHVSHPISDYLSLSHLPNDCHHWSALPHELFCLSLQSIPQSLSPSTGDRSRLHSNPINHCSLLTFIGSLSVSSIGYFVAILLNPLSHSLRAIIIVLWLFGKYYSLSPPLLLYICLMLMTYFTTHKVSLSHTERSPIVS